jgi:hypothetical protein
MFNTPTLTFQEFTAHEPLPLATLQTAILEFLQGREDMVLFGAQAVNAYVGEPRMTQDIDLMSTRAKELAQELQNYLSDRFHIAIRVREVGDGQGYRLYQLQKSGNRHLVALKLVEILPAAQRIEQVLVIAPPELIASKVIAYYQRRGKPKAGTDWRDLACLLLTFPELKSNQGAVADCLQASGASLAIVTIWHQMVAQDIQPTDEDEDFSW